MSLGRQQARGRRRRVLNEEVKGGAADGGRRGAVSRPDDTPIEGARYTDAANVENHPQVSDFIPRKIRSYALLLVAGIGAIAGLVSLHQRAREIGAAIECGPIGAFDMSSSGSLAAWLSSVLLAASAVVAILVYSLRRYRVDDYRTRYRVWLSFAFVTAFFSINASTALHAVLCRAMTHWTGWSALPGSAVWWVIAAAIALIWVGYRTGRDVAECRLAFMAFNLAIASYGTAMALHFGWLSAEVGSVRPAAVAACTMLGHLLLLTSVLRYARYVVLDVQGLIGHRSRRGSHKSRDENRPQTRPARLTAETKNGRHDASPEGSSPRRKQAVRRARNADDVTEWVDGSQPQADDYGETPRPRRLSKSERKRLRKLKARQRAA